MKTQQIRLADVFVVGPLMIFGGYKLARDQSSKTAGLLLALLGAGTVVYNGRNYLRVQREGFLPGGKAIGKDVSSIDPEQLHIGIEKEMAHTNDPEIAKEIALDHLLEDPQYYTKLMRAGL